MTDENAKGQVVRFMLRLPAKLDRATVDRAQKNNRSKNNYIISVLEQHLKASKGSDSQVGSDMSEQAVLKWFRNCSPKKKQAFLDFLQADLDD